MQKFLMVLSLLVVSQQLFAQTAPPPIPISIGYLGHFGYQPGVKIGTQFALRPWPVEEQPERYNNFYVSPQLGIFTWPERHTSFLANIELGYKRSNNEKNKYNALSLGLGYLQQSQISSWRVSLSGESEAIRENWNWLLYTLNYEFGKAINNNLGWYTKFTYGFKTAASRATTAVVFVELGLNFKL